MLNLMIMFHIYPPSPLPSLVLALRSGGAGAARGTAGVGVAAGAAAGEAVTTVSAPPSVPATTMFSTAAATFAAARAALAVAQPYSGAQTLRNSAFHNQTHKRPVIIHDKGPFITSQMSNLVHNCNTFRGLLVLNSLHLAIIKVIILDTAILGFLAAIKGLRTQKSYDK